MAVLPELIEAIADAQDKEPEELEMVLEDHISTEAIQQLDEHTNDSWVLQFDVLSHTVQIEGNGTIVVDGREKRTFC